MRNKAVFWERFKFSSFFGFESSRKDLICSFQICKNLVGPRRNGSETTSLLLLHVFHSKDQNILHLYSQLLMIDSSTSSERHGNVSGALLSGSFILHHIFKKNKREFPKVFLPLVFVFFLNQPHAPIKECQYKYRIKYKYKNKK